MTEPWILPDPDEDPPTGERRPLPYRLPRQREWDWVWLLLILVALAVGVVALVFAVT